MSAEPDYSRSCNRGICAGWDGHPGTCAEISGWEHVLINPDCRDGKHASCSGGWNADADLDTLPLHLPHPRNGDNTMSTLEARIAEVVGAHVPSGTIVACGGCSHDRHDLDNGDGSQVDTWDARWHDFADHLAEVLAPAIREAQAEALREAADLLAPKGILWWGDSGVRVSDGPFGMPQGSLDDWLRARADNLEAP